MNTSNIKSYAPKARNAFIVAMSKMAAKYGITESAIAPMEIKGDLAIIADRPFPKSIAGAREALVKTVEQKGFIQTIEKVAYSWFNRLCAIRYMELHDYLGHGRRVLSHQTEPTGYQILEECLDIDLVGLNVEKVRELQLDGTKDEELYRELLLAQCHALHTAMPFLFEAIDDETELLLPENLTKTDSFIHDLVTDIPEEDWQSVEVIGWLYQFYISEKKDEVIGNVVKSEDIPAATQLFTPNWIVKYMVQNSLGAQWLATYPESPLKAQMEYYIEPAEQTVEVNAQLKEVTPTSLNPEELTLMDPASGSGHILVEAYDLFKAIYLERGYRQRDIAKLILEKNLFGLDIDQRAAQLTGFALMMKGREDDRRLFERGVKLNVMALVDSNNLDIDSLIDGINISKIGLQAEDITVLKELFEHATTFGSLIQVPTQLVGKLILMQQLSEASSQDLFVSEVIERLAPLVQQAVLLAAQYDAVVANPPYMGTNGMNALVKDFVKDNFRDAKNDLFACFIERGFSLTNDAGHNAMVTMESWMFLSGYEQFRRALLGQHVLRSLAHLPYDGKQPTAMGINFGIAVVSTQKTPITGYRGHYCCSRYFELNNDGVPVEFPAPNERLCTVNSDEFSKIPGSPITYWIPFLFVFDLEKIGAKLFSGGRIKTHDGATYLRFSWEVSRTPERWRRIVKGGDYRKHGGNEEFVVDWSPKALAFYESKGGLYPEKFVAQEGICWSKITSASPSFRIKRASSEYDSASPTIFTDKYRCDGFFLALLNSPVALSLLRGINPTLNTQVADVLALPICDSDKGLRAKIGATEEHLIQVAIDDWDAYERSWDFQLPPILTASLGPNPTLESSYSAWICMNLDTISEMKRLEEENNRLFIDAYGLEDQLTPDVPIEQVTLTVNPAYRYSIKITEAKRDIRFREDTMEELVSYSIGCMMGRYSLDEPGLIYANNSNVDFDASRYTEFSADDDGIIPLTNKEWFSDDAANRLVEFISVAWSQESLEENLGFLAENLSPKKGEDSRDTIRRYLCDKFYKDHMQTYKKRPIYWLFSSGKQKAFQCLVYLHRYNEGTLARMRTEYVIPLTAKLSTHVNKLENDVEASSSTAEIKKLEKEIAQLHKQQVELSTFDEKLRHYADQRISLDLDDGVKVNYGKFGDLLAEVKAIHGKKT